MKDKKAIEIDKGMVVLCPFLHSHRFDDGRVVRRAYRAGTFPAKVLSVGTKWIHVYRATNKRKYKFLKTEVRPWGGIKNHELYPAGNRTLS